MNRFDNFLCHSGIGSAWRVLCVFIVPISLLVSHSVPAEELLHVARLPRDENLAVAKYGGTLTGIVVDTLCRKIADTVVNIGTMGTAVKTRPDGSFSVDFVPRDIASDHQTLLASVRPAGYTENQVKIALGQGQKYHATIVVKSVTTRTMSFAPYKQTLTIQEPYQGWVSLSSASLLNNSDLIVVEPVTAQLTPVDFAGGERYAFPGNDFLGVTNGDQPTTVALENIVSAEIKLIGASGTYYHRLATPATLRIAIPGSVVGRFADRDSIPLWYYDTSIGIWRQEGEGKIRRDPSDGRLWAEGQVSHMTWWSFASPIREYACLRFRPMDEETGTPLNHFTFKVEGVTFNGGTQVTVRGNEVAFTTKRSTDTENPEKVRLMFHEQGVPTYLRQDPTNPTRYYKVSMPRFATPIPMPSATAKHTVQWNSCHDLGILNVSSY